MANIGFVGLGMMGSRMVIRLLDAGHSVTGYNRTKSRAAPLIERGMRWAETPREAAASSDVVITNVRDSHALLAVAKGAEGVLAGLSAGKVFIDMSTISPSVTRQLAKEVAQKGAFLLDAPVSGSKLTLEQGKLTIMVGGDVSAFERVRSVMEVIGPIVIYIGESGMAMALKLAINISIITQIVSFAEGVVLAEKYGVPREKAVEVMLNSAIASPALKYRGPFVNQMPDEAWFDVEMSQKDITLALELGRELGISLPTASVASDLLSAAQKKGWEHEDFAVVYKVLKTMSNMEG
ncbi:MAG: NAD(P)-dependent oxidoreductase [Anaerolineae bacterium]|nr:MAG: NAD(P)-dependent oxidoreductase [Anaerolineae bacterium]